MTATITVEPTTLDAIRPLRELYRSEMRCQIIHDSIHRRPGWTQEYLVRRHGVPVGYGSVAIAGPWRDRPAVYEFFVIPEHRTHLFDLFEAFDAASVAPAIEVQTNDPVGAVVLHAYGRDIVNDALLFHDRVTTRHHLAAKAVFRGATAADAPDAEPIELPWRTVVEIDGLVVASGGVLFHYNPPYGDIYMDVDEQYRRQGFGTYIVQELKRMCYQRNFIPGARCNPKNVASRQTLQRAGFVPCGYVLSGTLRDP